MPSLLSAEIDMTLIVCVCLSVCLSRKGVISTQTDLRGCDDVVAATH